MKKEQSEVEKTGGQVLYEALCRNLIYKILKNNPTDICDVDLILEGYIHKAKFYDTIFEKNFIIPKTDSPEKWVETENDNDIMELLEIELKWRGEK